MKELTDNIYNDNPVHDMEVDYDYHINTGELSDIFDDDNLDNLDNYIYDINDWD